ncbi:MULTISPECIES: PLP-dependent aminotransferase family protein [Thalassospira]|uniref:Transcriptional regulator n=2 Tax=Thalassospira TaxID=168934 RepID=A0A367WAF7_9PROT|nr:MULTISPECIES: PLP-dependent aminotransferase family protein [Thalassospira]MDG4719968.1 PLP-dependent aminotransferase family protein [Thalassospira sp. FZY0004]RCK38408.1 transcriptional regulator [Thalassospira profundimaris]
MPHSDYSWIYPSQTDKDTDQGSTAYRRLYHGIRAAILDGRLHPGERLPASRDLATSLGVSRNTVVASFDLLTSEGYLETRIGAGSFVARSLPDQDVASDAKTSQSTADTSGERPLRLSQSAIRMLAYQRRFPRFRVARPFNPATPDLDGFPFDLWARLLRRAWRAPQIDLTIPDDPMGLVQLRDEVAKWLRQSRGVNCHSDQVMIVSGAQQALDLTARALVDPGDIIATEDPGYEGIRGVLASSGAVVHPVAVDDEGLNVDGLMATPSPARIVVTTPSRNYPLGTTLSLARRLALLQWAKSNDAWIVEDDYDSDYRYDGPPLSSLQGLDNDNRVIYVGTFSRVLFPGIRLGYLVLPPALIPAFRGMRGFADGVPAPTTQAALAAFFAEGHFGSHVRKMRMRYGERRAHLKDLIANTATGLLSAMPSDGGLHLCARLLTGQDDIFIQERMVQAGLDCRALSSYYHDKSPENRPNLPQGLVLGFAGWEQQQLSESFGELIEILQRSS